MPKWGSGRDSQIALACVLGLVVLAILTGHALLAATIVVFCLCVLVSPWATGWWWRMRVGGREPSAREQEAYNDAIAILDQHAPGELPCPVDWFVLDLPEPEAATCGQTLMLTHAMLEDPRLAAALGHDIGHLANRDSRITAAVNRLIIHPLREPHPDQERYKRQTKITVTGGDPVSQTVVAVGLFALAAKTVLRACRGGFGLWLLHPLWGQLWRENEYAADQYAASLGVGEGLADFLQTNALIYDQPVPFAWLTPHTHPPTELRIDRLRAAANTRSEPSFAS